MSNEKKYRRSGIAIVCYILSALMLVYTCYLIGNTISTINNYYAQYEMSATFGETFGYIVQSALEPLIHAIVFFMLAYILDTVRKNNPANYLSDAEIEEAKIAKKEAKEAKKFAKGEAAAAKAGHSVSTESSVEADFAKSFDEEMKKDESKASKKPAAKTSKKPEQGGEKKKENGGEKKSSGGRSKSQSQGGKSKAAAEKKDESKSSSKRGSRKTSSKKPAADKQKAAKDETRDGFEAVVAEAEKSEN